MYTLEEAIEKFYDKEIDYEGAVRERYQGAVGIEKEDRESLIIAVRNLKRGDERGAVVYLRSCDTEVREQFVQMMRDFKK